MAVGRIGYFEKAKRMGLEKDIVYAIKEYVDSTSNPQYRECYDYIQKKFPQIFHLKVSQVYAGNDAKIIKSANIWEHAFRSSHSALLAKSELLLAKILDDDNESSKNRLKAIDIIIKRDKDMKQLEQDKTNINIDNITFGYKGEE